ncbi:glycosyltransferase [Streptomyces sp. NPDC059070]|uniref:glycosyltransferase n=1 Tax=Streptomyces sp. NPDC059070 TaxID=3346713 RepID=UPI00368DD78E
MRILIATAGSYGDVAPYCGLGARLRRAGHEVSLATHERFAEVVRRAGLGFGPLPVDPREVLASHRGQRLLKARARTLEAVEIARIGRAVLPALGAGVLEAAEQGTDLLLLSTSTAPPGRVVAEALGVPSMGLYLQPLAPTGDFPPAVLGIRPLGRYGNRAAGAATRVALDRLFAPAVRTLRAELGLPPLGGAAQRRREDRTRWPVLHGVSPTVLPRPADWRPGLEVGGYWWPHPDPGWRPEPRLVDFLASGPPPVFVGFGSLVVADAERLGAVVREALRRAGLRGVVQAGWTGLSAEGDDMLAVDEVPHHWLFPRTAAVVHHGGAGTTAAGLRAGVPSVPVPAQLDAGFWAARLTALGVSPGAVPLRALRADRLAGALRAAVERPGFGQRARALAARIGAEDGAAAVLAAVERAGGGR